MANTVVLKERPRKMTPSEMIEAIQNQKDAFAAMEEFLAPMADMSTFRELLAEVQEQRGAQMAGLENVQSQMGRIAEAVSASVSGSAESSRMVSESLPAMMGAMQEQLSAVMAANQSGNEAIAKAIKSLATAVGKMNKDKSMPPVEAEVTSRDLTGRIEKFVVREA